MQFWAILRDSIRESIEKKIFWVLIAITLLVCALMLCTGFDGPKMSLMFGMAEFDNVPFSPHVPGGADRLGGIVVYGLVSILLSWGGMILMLIATAGVFPNMLDRGAIDVLLSKPLSRPRLFIYKYLACMVFVLLQATIFIGSTFLVMGFRWGVWRPGYLASIPLVVLLFSYLFCISAWIGVKYRSTVAAVLLSIGAWFLFALVHQAPATFDQFPSLKKHKEVYLAVRVVSWIPPKTGDFDYLAARWAGVGTSADAFGTPGADQMTPQDREMFDRAHEIERKMLLKSPIASIGSSLIFEAVVVLMAMWTFVRRDY